MMRFAIVRSRAPLLAAIGLAGLLGGCQSEPTAGSVSSSSGGVAAYPLELPGVSSSMKLGEYVEQGETYFANPRRPLTLVVMWAESGVVKTAPFSEFKGTHANWAAWLVKSYTPGFKSPTFPPTESDHYKWLSSSLVNKGGEVGVVIEPPKNSP